MTSSSRSPGGGVDGEHHAGTGRLELALHDDRNVHVRLCEVVDAPVVDSARAEQRAPAATHGVDHRVGSADVQEGLVHAREGARGGVLRSRRGAHGHGDGIPARPVPTGLARQALVGRADLRSQRLGHGRLVEQRAGGDARRLQCGGVLHVHRVQQLGQLRTQPGLGAVRGVCRGADHKSIWHGQPGGGQLPQVRALAARVHGVLTAQPRERAYGIDAGAGVGIGGNAHRVLAPRVAACFSYAEKSSRGEGLLPPHSPLNRLSSSHHQAGD